MADPNPAPTIDAIEADNTIDLVKLGPARLITYIDYDGIAEGHYVDLNWRGCDPNGVVYDDLRSGVEVTKDNLSTRGVQIDIENKTLKDVDQGWVFYSYRVDSTGTAGDESNRIFFYVGKRPRAKPYLPVLQIKESHDLHLDLATVGMTAGVWAGPYEAMAAGDTLNFHCRRFDSSGKELTPAIENSETVSKEQVGKPFPLFLSKSDLNRIAGGRIEVNYGIQYVDTPDERTLSSLQVIHIIPPTSPVLPALEIVGHTPGQVISPARYADGMPVRIAAYPGMSVGDRVYCYANSEADDAEQLVLETQVDASTIDKGFIEFFIDSRWLKASNGNAIDLRYQFAWIGSAMSAPSYPATVREALNLPMAIVVGAVPGEDPVEGEGELDVFALNIKGVNIKLDELTSYQPGDGIEMLWDGYGTTGHYIATDPIPEDARTFNIPPQYIPANFGKTVQVYYRVTPRGETAAETSGVFGVRVLGIPAIRYPGIQSRQAQQAGGKISVKAVPAAGELFSYPTGWPSIRAGQHVNAVLVGKNIANNERLTLPIFDNHTVSASEGSSQKLEIYVKQTELAKFKLEQVAVQATITYEPGAEITLRETHFTLVS